MNKYYRIAYVGDKRWCIEFDERYPIGNGWTPIMIGDKLIISRKKRLLVRLVNILERWHK